MDTGNDRDPRGWPTPLRGEQVPTWKEKYEAASALLLARKPLSERMLRIEVLEAAIQTVIDCHPAVEDSVEARLVDRICNKLRAQLAELRWSPVEYPEAP